MKHKSWIDRNKYRFKGYSEFRMLHKKHDISKEEWNDCKEYFNHSCAYCGVHVNLHYRNYKGTLQKIDLHKEHVDHNGANDITNCIPSCINCNSQKWTFTLEEWYNDSNENYTYERLNKIKTWIKYSTVKKRSE